jgi:pimeloyl-ACP methyl ester carboxylesterase
MFATGERTVAAYGGATLCAQAFGAAGDPAVLLVAGARASMLCWPDGFCDGLAAAPRQVIRYDQRDTGRATAYAPGRPPYGLEDLAADAAAVLDAYGVERAHVAGMGMGGVVAQLVALEHPERVATLTAIGSTPLDAARRALPAPAAPPAAEGPAGREELAAVLQREARACAGTRHPFDAAAAAALAERELARAASPASRANHALLRGGEQWHGRLARITAPLLVIHGTADPVLPHAHGVALARAVPGADMLTIAGAGHELHPGDRELMLRAIVRHTAPRAAAA